jgi:hypothetical protein
MESDESHVDEAPRQMRVTRRVALTGIASAAGLAGIGIVAGGPVGARNSLQQASPAATTGATSAIGEAAMPQWQFIVTDFLDPYEGVLSKPDALPAGLKLVALQVILVNDSDQPLEFSVSDVRLRDLDGTEYRGGDYIGEEPRLVSQNLPDGERTRGWVWYAISESAQPAEIVFVAPPPVLRISL